MNDTIITIDENYSFTIPPALRDILGWKPGTQLAFLPQPDGTILIEEVEPQESPVSQGQ